MPYIAKHTIQALRESGTEELPYYEAVLRAACIAFPPPFGQAWYGEKYRAVASDPAWFAASLIANAEKEGEGSRKLWDLVARTPNPEIAEAVRKHAIDESRHALLYVVMCELVFPDALEGDVGVYADSLSPRYSPHDFPAATLKAPEGFILDELIQMNIGEIRTRIHQLLMRSVITAYCPEDRQDRLIRVLDSLLNDETRHIQYTARLYRESCADGASRVH